MIKIFTFSHGIEDKFEDDILEPVGDKNKNIKDVQLGVINLCQRFECQI